jgi:hypothetical protein
MSQCGRKIGTVRSVLMTIYHDGLEYLSNGFRFRDRQAGRQRVRLTDRHYPYRRTIFEFTKKY